jgi:hypothetical protein
MVEGYRFFEPVVSHINNQRRFIMSKVLSTKLSVGEVDRFNTAAKQQGLSKAGLLKRLVKEYLHGSNEGSKTSINCEPENRCSLEKRQTPAVCKVERLPLDKQEVSQNRKQQKCQVQVHPTYRVQNCTLPVSTDMRLADIYSTAIDLQTLARLAKALDSQETIIDSQTLAWLAKVPNSQEAIARKLSVE